MRGLIEVPRTAISLAGKLTPSTMTEHAPDTIAVQVNGEPRVLAPGTTAASLLQVLGLGGRRVAVEVNEDLLPRSRLPDYRLRDGDRVEIVQAIGGG